MKAELWNETIKILDKYEAARNSDAVLWILYLKKNGINIPLTYENISLFTELKTMERYRRKIQHEEGRYQATDKVVELRKEKEEEFKEWSKS